MLWSTLPQLEELVLDGNPISSVRSCPEGCFSSLKRLSLSSTG
jgi:hypothetical protein